MTKAVLGVIGGSGLYDLPGLLGVRREKISTGKACELLGLERMAFVRRAAELGVPVYLTTEEEWKVDLATLEAWRQQRS